MVLHPHSLDLSLTLSQEWPLFEVGALVFGWKEGRSEQECREHPSSCPRAGGDHEAMPFSFLIRVLVQ